MAISDLTVSQALPTVVFRHFVLTNLQYWGDYVSVKSTDTVALDRGRSRIIKAISFGLELEEAWPLVRELIEAFSPYMERGGYWETWKWLLTRAIEVGRQSRDLAGVVVLSALLARLLQQQNHFRRAIAYHRYTIRIARQIGDSYNEARACSNLGYLYVLKGRWYRAEVLCCHALAIFEQLGDSHGRAHTENHLGILYTHRYLWKQAQQRLKRACALWRIMDDKNGLMRGLINLGALYNDMEQPEKSLPCLERALELAKLTGEEAEIGAIYLNMGFAYQLTGDLAQAEAYAWQAEAILRRLSSSFWLAEVWHNLGVANMSQGKWAEAGRYLDVTREAWQDQNKYFKTRILKALVEYELARNNRSGAIMQLNELERFICQHEQHASNTHLQMLLKRYRNQLAESAS